MCNYLFTIYIYIFFLFSIQLQNDRSIDSAKNDELRMSWREKYALCYAIQ